MQGRPTDTMSARTAPGCQGDSISAIRDFRAGLRYLPGSCFPYDALRNLACRPPLPERGTSVPPAGPSGRDCQTSGECRSRMMFRSSYIVDAPRKQVNRRPLYENMRQEDTAAVSPSEGGAVLSASSSLPCVLKPVLTSATRPTAAASARSGCAQAPGRRACASSTRQHGR